MTSDYDWDELIALGLAGEVSNLDPSPLYAFGHGRSYTTFAREGSPAATNRWSSRPTGRTTSP